MRKAYVEVLYGVSGNNDFVLFQTPKNGSDFGITHLNAGDSLVFYERYFEPDVADSQAELEDTVVHEVGHVFGAPEPVSVNANHIPEAIHEIRRTKNQPDGPLE